MIDPSKKVMVKVKKPLDIEKTKRFDEGKKLMKEALDRVEPKKDVVEDNVQGISIDKKTATATPKVFVRTVKKEGNEKGYTEITGNSGERVFRGKTSEKATKDAVTQAQKQTDNTNEDRTKNANFYNTNSGSKKELDEQDKKNLVKLNKAKFL